MNSSNSNMPGNFNNNNNNFSNQLNNNQQMRPLLQTSRSQEMNNNNNNIQLKNNIPPQRTNQYQYRLQNNPQQNRPNIQLNNSNNNNNNENQTESIIPAISNTESSNLTISSQQSSQKTLSPSNSVSINQETSQILNESTNNEDHLQVSNDNLESINMIETNLAFYLELNENKDEEEIVFTTKTTLSSETKKTNNSLLDDFLNEQTNQFDISKVCLKSIKNPILTKYEQDIKENSKYNLNKSEKKIFNNYNNQNEMFKNIFDESNVLDELDEKHLNLIEKLMLNLTKSTNLFFHLFGTDYKRLNNMNKLIIRLLLVDDNENQSEKKSPRKHEWSFKVKQLKLGLRLANLLLTRYDKQTIEYLLNSKLQEKLIDLIVAGLSAKHDINEPIRLKCLNVLNNSIQTMSGMEYFVKNSYYSRLLDYFLSLKQNSSKSRLILAITQILSHCKFYESLELFKLKCKQKFIQKLSLENFEKEILNLFEHIYIYSIRNLQLNKNLTLAELKMKSNDETSMNENEINDSSEQKTKSCKKFKSNDFDDDLLLLEQNQYEYIYYNDDFDAKFNKLPLQNLFDKFPIEFIQSAETAGSQSMHILLIRLFHSLDTLKYVLLLKAYICDNKSNSKLLIYLNDLINKFLNDLYNVSKLNGYSYNGIEYLLNNTNLTKCWLKVMSNQNDESEKISKIGYSLNALSLVDSLIYNFESLIIQTSSESTQIEYILLESVGKLQSLTFLLNDPNTINYNLVLTNFFCSPDGNMSNKYIFNLLNWLELMIVEKHFNSYINYSNSLEKNSIRCYFINSLIEIFYILCKSNKRWNLPYFINESTTTTTANQSEPSSLILIINNKANEETLNDYRLCLKRLNQYSSLLINSLSSIRIKSYQEQTTISMCNNSLNTLIYKLKVIKSCIEPICITTSSFSLTDNKIASNLANMSSYYYKISYLNTFIDLFKRTIDKNLSLYFLKQYYNNSTIDHSSSIESDKCTKKKITMDFLNSNITILSLLKNMVTFQSVEINLFDLFHKSKTNGSFNIDLHVTSLNLVKYSLDLNEKFNSKRYLGHLISRNFLLICLNLLSKLSDYLLFYSKSEKYQIDEANTHTPKSGFTTLSLDLEQFNMIISLVDPTIHLIRTILCKIIKIRNENFTDMSPLPILFRFNAAFNYCLQTSLILLKKEFKQTTVHNKTPLFKANLILLKYLNNQFDQINKNIIDIFMSFTQPILAVQDRPTMKTSLFTCLYRELARFTVEKPFNFYYGLKLFSELLPLPLPIPINIIASVSIDQHHTGREEDTIMLQERRLLSEHLEFLFEKEKLKKTKLFDTDVSNQEKYAPTFISMIKALIMCSNKSRVNKLLKRVCIQVSDLSDKMCSLLLECLFDHAIYLLAKIKDENFDVNDQEEDDNQEEELPQNENDKKIQQQQDDKEELMEDTIINDPELIKKENDKINVLINEIIDSHVQNGSSTFGTNNKEFEIDSLYDTEMEDTKVLSTTENPQKLTELLLDETKDSLIKTVDETKKVANSNITQTDSVLKENYKKVVISSFSQLINFISDLLSIERNGCEINPIRVKFIQLLTENNKSKAKNKVIKSVYLKFVYDCIKYCNHLDLNCYVSSNKTGNNNIQQDEFNTNDSEMMLTNEFKHLIQECLFGFIESIIRCTPELLANNFKPKLFIYEETNNLNNEQINSEIEEDEENFFEQQDQSTTNSDLISKLILNQIQKCLVDHLSITKLDSLTVSSSVLRSLIMLCKLYKNYLNKIKAENLIQNESIINPLLKKHLIEINTKSLSNFIRELDNVFQHNSVQFIDLLVKFFIYINLLIENFPSSSRKLKDLFEWHNSKFNIIGLQIDMIPISKSLKNKPSNENSLDNLLILIGNTERLNQDANHIEKIEFCFNQTKRLVNILNEVSATNNENLTNESFLNRLEAKLQTTDKINLNKLIDKQEFQTYFMKRLVFSDKFNKQDFKSYESKWINKEELTTTDEKDSQSYLEIDLHQDYKNLFKNQIDFNLTFIQDKNLNKQLINNLDYSNLEELFCETIQTTTNNETNNNKKQSDEMTDNDNMFSSSSSLNSKTKNMDVINTRTGLKYKAPMRGGHSNPAARHINSNHISSNHTNLLVNNMTVLGSSEVTNDINAKNEIKQQINKIEIINPSMAKIVSTLPTIGISTNNNNNNNNNSQNNNLNYLKNDELINSNRNTIRKSNSFISSDDLVNENDNLDHFNRNNNNNNSRFFGNNNNNNSNFNFLNRERSYSSGNLTSFNNNNSTNNDMFISQMPPPNIIPNNLIPPNLQINGNNVPNNNQQQSNMQRFTRV